MFHTHHPVADMNQLIVVSSSSATRAAAPPPTPLNRATSCGIWVICTRRAAGTASTAPTAIAIRMAARWFRSVDRNTVTSARAAPAAPIRLPRRALRGEDNPFRARMKQSAATRYRTSVALPESTFTGCLLAGP